MKVHGAFGIGSEVGVLVGAPYNTCQHFGKPPFQAHLRKVLEQVQKAVLVETSVKS